MNSYIAIVGAQDQPIYECEFGKDPQDFYMAQMVLHQALDSVSQVLKADYRYVNQVLILGKIAL